MRQMMRRSTEFVAGALCAAALILITLGGAGLISAQVFLGPKRDFVGLATSGAGQRDVSVDSTTSPPRLEGGRSQTNSWRITGNTTGNNPTLTVAGDANLGFTVAIAGTGTTVLGGIHTTGIATFPAVQNCNTDVAPSTAANMIPTRVAANNWALARTAVGAETYNLSCDLNLNMTRTTASKGIRLDGISIAYEIVGGPASTATALTSQALPTLRRTTYANATANSIDASGLTLSGTMATATQTTPYLTGLTISSASFQVTTNTNLNLDWQVVLQNLTQYRLYAVTATYSHALY